MNNNIAYFNKQNENTRRKFDRAIKKFFSKHIKGNFLIEMMHLILNNRSDIIDHYNWDISQETIITGSDNTFHFDLCRAIIGCHSSNIIFLTDEERGALERDDKYKNELLEQVVQNIYLRQYGSQHFRTRPILPGELFLAYNVPYNTFVMAVRSLEILHTSNKSSVNSTLYYTIAIKILATLSLLEDGFFDNCYPICRTIIELNLKLLLLEIYPNLEKEYNKFNDFEIRQSRCEQEYPEDFNELYLKRLYKDKGKKIDYLHYGWVDSIPNYHTIVKYRPYSINGILNFLREAYGKENENYFDMFEFFYKNCHSYSHGNVGLSRYPLLYYFEISIMLHNVILPMYSNVCQKYEVDSHIDNIDILEKAEKDFSVLNEQYNKKSSELFERHYKNRR